MATILDGTGRGFEAGVDSTNRLQTEAVALFVREEAVGFGNSYEIGAFVTLTGTAETTAIFVKNNEDRTLIIDRFEFSTAESTGGTSEVALLTLYTGTTSISNGTATAAVNANFASALGLNAAVEFGNGSTSAQTGGTAFGSSYIKLVGQSIFDGPWALPRGASIALNVTPPASNSSLPFTVRILCHRQRAE
jgi:hypothetical protein